MILASRDTRVSFLFVVGIEPRAKDGWLKIVAVLLEAKRRVSRFYHTTETYDLLNISVGLTALNFVCKRKKKKKFYSPPNRKFSFSTSRNSTNYSNHDLLSFHFFFVIINKTFVRIVITYKRNSVWPILETYYFFDNSRVIVDIELLNNVINYFYILSRDISDPSFAYYKFHFVECFLDECKYKTIKVKYTTHYRTNCRRR